MDKDFNRSKSKSGQVTQRMQQATNVEDVIVAGGGDAGKLAALIFKQENPSLDVRVIDDFGEPPREVGKSTFSSITTILHDYLNIDHEEFIQEVNPVWKHSVYLEDWTGAEFFTPFDTKSVLDRAEKPLENAHYRYREDIFTTVNELATLDAKTPFIERGGNVNYRRHYPYVAYHLNVYKFDTYLATLMERRGIKVIDDQIETVNTDGEWITSIESATDSYEADLFVDTTGFKRVLASSLPVSFSDYDFRLDSAVVTQLPITLEEIVPATVVRTLDNGWTWQIDTTDSRDLGYVYASDYTTRDDAERAFREEYSIPESAALSHHEFRSGQHDRAWVGNCLIAGDAFAFVEPLQATSLSTHAHIMYDVVKNLTEHSWVMHEGLRRIVNSSVNAYWNEIYDFLAAFYRYSSGETAFWQDMQTVGDDEEWAEYEDEYRVGAGFILARAGGDSTLTFGKVFNIHQTDYTLYNLGVPIDLHESGEVPVSEATRAHVQEETTKTNNTVDAFLTYPEIYSTEYIGEPDRVREKEEMQLAGDDFQT